MLQCPLCRDAPLEPHMVGSTEVDMCARCRGIWLDRGELDRLLADDAPVGGARASTSGDRPSSKQSGKQPKKQKRKAKKLADLLEEVLDF